MKKSEFVIRPATQADIEKWYGKTPLFSVRAVVGELDGEVIAFGGVYRDTENIVGVSGLKEAMRGRKKDIVRLVRAARKILQEYPRVVAYASEQEGTADGFMKHLGFKHQGRTANGETYLWETT